MINVFQPPCAIDELAIVGSRGSFTIQRLERIHDVVKAYLTGWRLPQLRGRFHRADVGCPGRKNCSLFLRGHVRIVHNLHGCPERTRGMEEIVEIQFASVCSHSRVLAATFDLWSVLRMSTARAKSRGQC